MSIDLACIIYADADSDELRQLLQQSLPEGGSSFSLIVKNNTIEIVKNLDFDPEARLKFPEGFLSF